MKKIYLFALLCMAMVLRGEAQTTLLSGTGDGGFETGTDFTSNGWTLVSTTTNTWWLGTAGGSTGARAAFVGPDASTNSYTNSSRTCHFYRDILVPGGSTSLTLTFSLKGNGETGWDRLLVYTAPTTVTPVANAPAANGTSITGATLVYTQAAFYSSFTTQTVNLPASLAGTTFRLIFTWQNDALNRSNPPATVDNINLTAVCPAASAFTASASPATLCPGASLTLTSSLAGATSYSWTGPAGSGYTSTLRNPATFVVSAASGGVYTVSANMGACGTYTATTTVTVNPAPTVSISPTSSCAPPVTLTSTVGGSSSYTYSWSPSTGLSSSTVASPSSNPSSTQNYTLTVTAANTCTNTATASVGPAPTIAISPAGPVCGRAITASGAGTGGTYSWSPAAGLSATTGATVTATPSVTTTYTVTGVTTAGCIGTQTITVLATPSASIGYSFSCTAPSLAVTSAIGSGESVSSYAWTPTAGLSSTTASSVTLAPGTTATYTVLVTATNSCTNTASYAFTAVSPAVAVTPTSSSLCAGGAGITLTASGATSYTWATSAGLSATTGAVVVATPTTTTTYTVTGTNGVGCTNTATSTITVNVQSAPYTENFDAAAALPCGWSVLDVNADNYKWVIGTPGGSPTGYSSPNLAKYVYNSTTTTIAPNDWLFTKGISLNAGITYNLTFKYGNRSTSFPEGLEVKWGNAPSVAGMTSAAIFSNTTIASTAMLSSGTITLTPTATGIYYIGFHAISAANEWELYMDDFSIIAAPAVVTSSPTSLSFGLVSVGSSASQNITLSASYLTSGGSLTINAPANFMVYNGTSWVSSFNYTYTGSSISGYVVPVQFNPAAATSYSSAITISGGGLASAASITVSGTGVAACSGTPATPTATASNSTLCSGSATTLSVPTVIASGITYQWFVSPDNVTFNPISGATNTTYSTGISATRYYRCVETCTTSSLVATSNTITITGGVNYAAIPFTEDFEATWVNLCGTNDVPNLYWKNTPSTSDSSWRREDDAPGANTAAWGGVSSYLYSPVFSTTAHSARFHSGNITAGRRGIMDLYVDLSGTTGIKPVTYDVINTSGSDYLDVYVSTDGGLTFSATMDHFTTATSWTSRSFNINSNSATVVVRFVATADFGGTDIGIDNVKISNPCSGTPTAGTVTASSPTAIGSTPSVLSISGVTPGVTYQWVQRVPAVSGATSLVSGATSSTYSANPSVATSYYCIVTCGGSGLSATTNEVTVYHVDCLPVYDAASVDYTNAHMSQFALTGYSGSSISDVLPSATFNNTSNYVSRVSAVSAVNLQQGNFYPVTVTYSAGDVAVSNEIWIDYNDNGIFEASEAAVPVFGYSTSTTSSATANIYIPGSATPGTHLMRVRNANLDYITQPTAMDPCLNIFGGNQYFIGGTADYLVTIVAGTACSAAPTAGTVSSSVAYAGATSVINLTLSGFSTATGISFQWQKRTTSPVGSWANISGATSPTYTTVGQTASTDYQCLVTCAGSGLTATSLNFVTVTYLIDPTCTSSYTNASSGTTYPLATFQLLGYNGASINNTIPGYTYLTTGSYADQTGTVAPVTMQQGSTGAVTLTYAGSRARQETTIWIDFNDNGTFENSENVSGIMINPTSYTTAATGTTGTVTIPAAAALGPHRMRVRQAFSSGASSPSTTMSPCAGSDATNTYSYGVTTDFIVVIVKPVITATGGTFAFGNVVDGQVSAGTSFTITGTNLNPASGGSITLTASANFKVSLDGSTYATTVTVPYLTSTLPATTVYARFAPVSPANGAITGNIVVSGGGAVTTITPLTGTAYDSKITVTGTLAGFGDVYVGTVSAPQSYTVSAANLYPATDTVRISAPTNFSISNSSGSGYTSSLAFPVSGGSLSAQTIYVACTPGSTALGALSGNIVNSDANGAAANQLVAVSGNGVTQTLTVSDTTLSAGAVTIGGSASPVSFNLSGTYLTGYPGNITVTSSDAQYLLSLSSGGTYTSSVSVPFTAATMSSVPVYVKFTPSATGASSSTITFSGGGVSVPPTVVVHGSGANYCGVPVGQPTATSAYSPTSTGATVSVTPFSTAPDGYLLIQTTAPAAFTGSLTDGTTYTVGSTVSGGLVLGYFTTTPPFAVTGLPSNTVNNITVIPYNSSAACSGSPYYLTAGALSSQVTTCPAAPGTPTASSITSSAFRIQWTAPAAGATSYLVNVYKSGVPVAGSPFSTTSLYYDMAGLDMNTGYTFTVVASNAVCSGPASAAGSATTACANPTITVTPASTSTCASTNTNLVAGGAGVGGTYAWTPASNLTSTSAASVVANPATSRVYTVTGTNSFGCSSTATATINVVSGISAINVSPASASNCSGVATTLTAVVVGASTTIMSNNFSSGGTGSLNSWTVTNYPWGSTATPDPWAVQQSGFNPGASWGGGAMSGAPYFAFSFAYSHAVASILTSTSFSLAGLVNANLSFSHFFRYYTSTPYDTMAAVQLSTDGGSTWTTLRDYVADAVTVGSNSAFANASLNLTPYVSSSATNCKVRFIFRSYGYGWAVANVAVTGAAASATNPTWAPTAGLYTDAALTTAYTGDARSVVYAAPASNTTYSASVGSCGLSGSSAITVNPSPLAYNVTPTGSPAVCGSAVLGVDNSQSGLNYKLMRGTTLVNTIAGGGSSIDFGTQSAPGVYSIVALNTSTGCNTTMTGNVTVNEIPSFSLGSVPYICQGITAVPVAYSAVTGTPNTYSIDWNSAANAAGIADVSGATLSGGSISLSIPATGAVGSFDGTVTVSNGSCISAGRNAHIIVYATPAVTLSAVNVPCYNHAGSIDFTGVDSAMVNYTVDGGAVNHFTFTGTTYSLSTGTLTAAHSYDIISASNPVCATTYHDTITVTPTPMTWIGGTSGHETDWNTAANWSCGFVPTATDSVTIPGTLYAPVLPGSVTATVSELDVAAGTVVNINAGATINVKGNIHNSGTVAGNGRIVMNGSSAQKVFGIGTISNLELDNTNGATIQPASRMMISKAVYLTSGTLTTNDSLELLSTDTTAAARIAEIPSSGAGISGKVKTDQYVQGGYRRFRFWGHSFSETISLGQLTPYIDITGPGGSSNGFTTTTSNNPSAFRYDPYIGNDTSSYSSGWIPFTRINASAADSNKLHPGQGIRLFFRGSKGEGLGYLGSLGMYTPSSTINKMIGHVNQGAVSIPLKRGTDNQTYNQISNPYPSPVDIGTVLYNAKAAGQVTGGAFYVWNPGIGAGGQYMAIPIGTSAPEPYYIQANTSFQVRADHDGAHVDFAEADKAASATLNLFRAPVQAVRFHVYDTTYHLWDVLSMQFNDKASDGEDKQLDAAKPFGPDMNFYSIAADGHKLAIDARPYEGDKVVPLGVKSAYQQDFIVRAESIAVPAGGAVTLHDKLLNKYIDMKEGTEYRFTIGKDKTTQGDDRFELVLKSTTAAAVKGLEVSMAPNPASDDVKITFTSGSKDNVSVRIMDVSGVSIYSQDLGTKQNGVITVPMSNFAAGVYMVEIMQGDKTVTQRLVKE